MNLTEEEKDNYYNYLVNEILEAIYNADDYNSKELNVIKLDLIVNMHKILETRQGYNKKIKILSKYENKWNH